LGPPKSKREREAPFDPLLQEAIKKLWKENGKHEFVFCWEDGRILGANWTYMKFRKWLKDAKIELAGRNIVPHSSRHTLGTLLLDKGVSLLHIQELLGHQTFDVTRGYLHYTKKTLRIIGQAISEVREGVIQTEELKEEQEKKSNVMSFKAS
jgi:integrase